MASPHHTRRARRLGFASLVLAATLVATGCAGLTDAIDSVTGGDEPAPVSTPTPSGSAAMEFDSVFSFDGSVTVTSTIADELDIVLDIWAVDPRRTQEWTASNEKVFGFSVNANDLLVSDRAVLKDKRRVYLSQIAITSQTSQTSGQTAQPFQYMADPRTLVPADTLRSSRGLLINSFQGGLLVPETAIQQLPEDTVGLTLTFALTVSVEGTADDSSSFAQQTVYQTVPIAIYPPE
ncbi:fructose 1,6-bisphosphatase [Microbacterium sp. LRZ72]|uniref:fructose 1,6-bisphosphatase n=1 Tax=Microbacterium sp. LRZ72 TaxID=2942481 RepID=UPI0029BCEEC4|nr:fructose 1,6-bisphosphatase [Microbacterium sp. LRZ72]MDX2377994.1 fructose 1,6-bisphosphatase [Microbacterium sp. LRZ72]